MPEPAFHRPIPMESRVILPKYYSKERLLGTVVGVAYADVLFMYIVLLDKPIKFPAQTTGPVFTGPVRAVTVSGCELLAEDGTNWRIDAPQS